MSVVRQVARTAGSEVRPPGSAAEREAARRLAAWLRARGDAADVRARRTRGQSTAATGAGAAVAACSLVSVVWAAAGVACAAVGLLVLALEAADVPSPARLLFRSRDVADVMVAPGNGPPLVVCAPYGSPRLGWGSRLRLGVWTAVAGAVVLAACIARLAGAGGVLLGAVQLIPTLALLLTATAALDAGLAGWGPGEAGAAALAVAIHDELAARPPHTLSPALLLYGGARPRLEATVVLEVRPGEGGVRARDARPAAAARRATEGLGVASPQGRAPRGTIVLGGAGEDAEAAVDLALAVIDALDEDRGQARAA